MTVQITIIGTGQIGTSLGLALGEHKELFVRVGHDKDMKIATQAKQLGAFERVEYNLPNSVANAQIVILAIPLDQIQETLKVIASELQEDAVIMDTAPVKRQVLAWIKELLPPRRYYIGLTPAINPSYLEHIGQGPEAAHADLFKGGLVALVSSPGVPEEAIKLATDLIHLLGAEHLFIDPVELDSMVAATHILPELSAAALLNITIDQPGWLDARKLAGQPYAAATQAVTSALNADTLSSQAISASEHVVRLIDALVDHLYVLRDQISSQAGEKLKQELQRAMSGREKWLNERRARRWTDNEAVPQVELPSAKQMLAHIFTFGGGRKPKPPK